LTFSAESGKRRAFGAAWLFPSLLRPSKARFSGSKYREVASEVPTECLRDPFAPLKVQPPDEASENVPNTYDEGAFGITGRLSLSLQVTKTDDYVQHANAKGDDEIDFQISEEVPCPPPHGDSYEQLIGRIRDREYLICSTVTGSRIGNIQ
jgi:hypothetical protein